MKMVTRNYRSVTINGNKYLISLCDVDAVMKRRWNTYIANERTGTTRCRWNGLSLERFILLRKLHDEGITSFSGITHHINGDIHDKRRENLRPGTTSEACHNRGISRRNTSGVVGVSYHKKSNSWMSQITYKKKHYYRSFPISQYGINAFNMAVADRKKKEYEFGIHIK